MHTLTVTNTDNSPITKEITIVQYPLEYISGVPGVYSTREDFENNTYENYLAGDSKHFEELTVERGIFRSKVFVEGAIRYVSREGRRNNYYLGTGAIMDYDQNNNRMYLVQITSTNSNFVVARPKVIIDEEDGQLMTVDDDEDNNELVSPAFMLASQLGAVTSGLSWNQAQEQCKNYVEVVRYSNGEKRTLQDWRLPTYAELSVIAEYQKTQREVMDEVLKGSRYWTAFRNTAYNVPNPTTTGTGARCIRDVSPEDLAEFRAHNIR